MPATTCRLERRLCHSIELTARCACSATLAWQAAHLHLAPRQACSPTPSPIILTHPDTKHMQPEDHALKCSQVLSAQHMRVDIASFLSGCSFTVTSTRASPNTI